VCRGEKSLIIKADPFASNTKIAKQAVTHVSQFLFNGFGSNRPALGSLALHPPIRLTMTAMMLRIEGKRDSMASFK
jgi:hypothetical protein